MEDLRTITRRWRALKSSPLHTSLRHKSSRVIAFYGNTTPPQTSRIKLHLMKVKKAQLRNPRVAHVVPTADLLPLLETLDLD